MAKAPEVRTSNKQSEMTVMVLQLKGSDDMIREGLKALGSVVDKMSSRVVVVPASQSLSNTTAQLGDVQATEEIIGNAVNAAQEAANHDVVEPESRKPRKKSTFPIPNVLNDVDLDAGATKFVDYYAQKGSPETTSERYLVIGAWFRENISNNEISVHHVFTVFNMMNWVGPKNNWYQPFYDIRAKHHWFDKGSKEGLFAINTVGLSQAKKMSRTNA